MRTSQAIAISKPPVAATPLIAADHRALESQQCGHGIELERAGGVRGALAQFVKVQSGAECAARACENERAHRRISPQFFDRADQFVAQFHRQGIQFFWPVERQDRVSGGMAFHDKRSI
jgi:hypothetical protein